MIPDEESHGLGTRRESSKKKCLFPTILPRLRTPVIQKPFQMKTATSTVARVLPAIRLWRHNQARLYAGKAPTPPARSSSSTTPPSAPLPLPNSASKTPIPSVSPTATVEVTTRLQSSNLRGGHSAGEDEATAAMRISLVGWFIFHARTFHGGGDGGDKGSDGNRTRVSQRLEPSGRR